ncbi:HAD family hydrolase [Sneathiella limimaris]|uniref:HAD family hydrolase n=1 Tax=Sneathiella limimaris TaxID=1964213 RepID=UPI001469E6D3|nr:HAD family hydrolase [Sneathiella limimaris]
MPLSTIAFDADDTLWENEKIFKLTEKRFLELLYDHGADESLYDHLLETERQNLRYYGYGIKGFTLSMVETAIRITNGTVPAHIIQEILNAGREMHDHPAEPMAGVTETLKQLAGTYRILLITKGDLFDQERKLAQSGLGELFDGVEIVSEKTEETYLRIFEQYGDGPKRSMMVGNSLKSDIVPAVAVGAWGVHVPSEIEWAMEKADAPTGNARYHHLETITELPALIAEISADN